MIGLAILATRLGIDHNNVWGPRRLSLLVIGLILLFLSTLLLSYDRVSACFDNWKERIGRFLSHLRDVVLDSPIVRRFVGYINKSTTRFRAAIYAIPFVKSLIEKVRDRITHTTRSFRNSPVIQYLSASKERKSKVASWSLFVVIVLTYVWLVSVGRWTDWPGTTDYYEMLANAFQHGQAHLMIDPDPRLLELSDPYDYEARKDIPTPWDVVFYDGKFYLSYGPAPGLILAGIKLIIPIEIGDEYLVFGFMTGFLFFSVLLVLAIQRDLYQDLPWWVVIPGVMIAGLGNPMPWLLTRPKFYEVAISSGQFFMVAGIYWAFTALRGSKPVKWKLVLAGISWALACGSRITLAFAIVFLTLMVWFRIYQRAMETRRLRRELWDSTMLIAPLLLGAISLGWYNYVRFGSIAEFGVRYLISWGNFNLLNGVTFSSSYIIYNLYNYLVNPFRFLSVFPFVKPTWAKYIFWPLQSWAPKYYYVEQVAGILFTTPYVWFAVVPILILLRRIFRKSKSVPSAARVSNEISSCFTEQWLMISLIGAVVFGFLPLLFFVGVTMRYLADFVPALVLLSTIGLYQGYRMTSKDATKRKAFFVVILLVVLISALLSFLLSVTGYDARFENLNPELFEKIERLLAW